MQTRPQRDFTLVGDIIRNQCTVRMAFDDAAGFGDLVASIHVMTHLRELGFQGVFEVIYPEISIDRLTILFDLPANVPGTFEDTKNKIRFIKLNEFISRIKDHKVDQVTLGMTGALFPGWADTPKNQNFADFLNVKAFVWLYPYSESKHKNQIHIMNQPESHQRENSYSFIRANIADIDQAKEYLKNTPNGKNLITQNPALETFIQGMEHNRFNVFPLYGWTITKKYNHLYFNDPNRAIANMIQIITGARYAQLNGPDEFNNKPLVIPVFYHYQEELKQLMQLIHYNNSALFSEAGAHQMRDAIERAELSRPGVFSVADISHGNTTGIINELQNNQILLLSVGSLPKVVFDGLYTYTGKNIWPQLREGANSFNSLISTGRPHIRCGTLVDSSRIWEIGYDQISDLSLKFRLEHFYEDVLPSRRTKRVLNVGFCQGMGTWSRNGNIDSALGALIMHANNYNSSLSHYFLKLKDDASKPENDRIVIMLQDVAKLMPTPKESKLNLIEQKNNDCALSSTKKVVSQLEANKKLSVVVDSEKAILGDVSISASATSWLQTSKKSLDNLVYQNLIAKAAMHLGNLVGYYFDGLCQMIGECETYFPPDNHNLWNSGLNSCSLFRAPVNNGTCGIGVSHVHGSADLRIA